MHAKKKLKSHEISKHRAKIKGFIPADGPSPRRCGGAEPFIGVFFLSPKKWRIDGASQKCAPCILTGEYMHVVDLN